MKTVVTAQQCVTRTETIRDAVIVIDDGVVSSVGRRDEIELPLDCAVRDFGSATLVPGFIDMHIHGGAGYDAMEADPAGMAGLERHLASHGTTLYCPTTLTASMDGTLKALDFLAGQIEAAEKRGPGELRAFPLGIHTEGPFISPKKPGAHPPEHIIPPQLTTFEHMWQASRGHIKVMTIAPELPGADEVIQEATRRGICISMGHSYATLEQTKKGITAGARHVTHTFNAMRALDHREPGILGCVLNDDRVSAEMIVDGVHVAPEIVKLFLKAKSADRAVLVTDALSAAGMPDGRYNLGGFVIDLKGNRCSLPDGTLAGSVLTLEVAVQNVMKIAGWPLEKAVRLASQNPAVTLGICSRKGGIAPGTDADILALASDGSVLATIVRGVS